MAEYAYDDYPFRHEGSHRGGYDVTEQGMAGIGIGPFYVVSVLCCGMGLLGVMGAMVLGLLWLSELSEQYSAQTRRLLRALNSSLVVIHVLIMLFDQLSLWRSVVSLAAQGIYFFAMRTFPYIRLTSPACIGAIVAAVVDTAGWYSLLLGAGSPMYYSGFIGGCCWSMPMALLLSLGLEEDYLPGTNNHHRH